MDRSLMIAYTEVYEIINLMDDQYKEKIPKRLRQHISEMKLNDYNVKIDSNISLKEQEISKKALSILAVLNYNYWCVDDNKKNILINQYIKNEEEYQKKLREEYNYDKLFNTKNKNTKYNEVNECKQLVKYNKKESLWIKIINKIKKWINLT